MVLRCDVTLGNDNHILWPPVQGQLNRPFSSSGFLITECLVICLCKVLPGPSLLNGAPCHTRAIWDTLASCASHCLWVQLCLHEELSSAVQAEQQDSALEGPCHREGVQIETKLSGLEVMFSDTQLGPLVGQCICWGLGCSPS